MAKLLKLRRGTTSQHSSFTGAEGEVTVDTDKETLVVHNGSTAGGFPVMSAAGGTFTGNVTVTGNSIATSKFRGNDNVKVSLGDAEDLQIFHDGTNNEIMSANGAVHFYTGANIEFRKGNSSSNEAMLKAIPNGAVELYHDNSKKIETTSAGVTVTGGLTATGDVISVDVEPTGNISLPDSSGGSVGRLRFGASQDLLIYHDGSHSYIDEGGTGNLNIVGSTVQIMKTGGSENLARFVPDGASELYYDNAKKIETLSNGVAITGKCDIAGGHLYIDDGQAARFGTDEDLLIYHDGSNSIIEAVSSGAGDLYIQAIGKKIRLRPKSGEDGIVIIDDGAVELYHDNVKKFYTASNGCHFPDSTFMPDGHYAHFGDGNDLYIGHNGSHSYIQNGGTGSLYIRSNNVIALMDDSGDEMLGKFIDNGSVELYYDNALKFATTANGASIYGGALANASGGNIEVLHDSGKFTAGAGRDLQIYHDGTNSYIKDTAGSTFNIQATEGIAIKTNNSEFAIACNKDGAVELYYDGSKKLETASYGVRIQDHLHMHNEDRIKLGSGQDFQIYHGGTNAQLDNDTGNLELRNTGTFSSNRYVYIRGKVDENSIICQSDGYVEIYYNNSKKLETTNTGIQVTGNIDIDGNIDGADDSKLKLGTGDDLEIWHSGSDSFIKNHTNSLYIDSADEIQLRNTSTEKYFKGINNGAVQLFYDNSEKIKTTSTGVEVTGQAVAKGNSAKWETQESGGSTINIASGGLVGYVNVKSNHALVVKTNDTERYRTLNDGATLFGYTARADNEDFGVASSVSPNFWCHQVSSQDYVNMVMRHGRGLSGYTGIQIMFKRADNTNVGSITSGASSTAYNTSSDYRLKENQVAISDGITRLKQLKPYRFNFKDEPGKTVDGFFAHEVTPVVPEAITGEKDAMAVETRYESGDTIPSGKQVGDPKTYSSTEINPQQIDQAKIVPLLAAALQEALTKIETLETKVAALEAA